MRQVEYPILWSLARIFLAAPATSASSERIFSKAERVISKGRTSRLSAEKAGKMIWIAGVMKQEQEACFGTIESSLVDLCND